MKYIGDKVTTFLDFTMAGIVFVFGEKYFLHFVAFKVITSTYVPAWLSNIFLASNFPIYICRK